VLGRIRRRLLPSLATALAEAPAAALLGPRQAGKTTLAHEVARTRPTVHLELESESDRARLSEPELYLAQHADKLVFLDEIQRTPELFQTLRGLIDALAHVLLGIGEREARVMSSKRSAHAEATSFEPRSSPQGSASRSMYGI
jgi:predicted AAA+ superfamily ATPase